MVHGYVLKFAAVLAGLLSLAVVWSEVTFFNKEPVLSLFAQFLNLAKVHYDYFNIEVIKILHSLKLMQLYLRVRVKNILKRREESDTYLTHICRHRWSRKNLMK